MNDAGAPSPAVQRARDVLASALPDGWSGLGALALAEREDFLPRWRQTLAENHLLGLSWPKEYGGAGLSVVDQSAVQREFALAGAPLLPLPCDLNGISLLGPTLLAWGSEAQKSYFIPRILDGQHRWAQGYSEPDAGSDLFALKTKAVPVGGEWIIDGQKTWTSHGQYANWIFVLARTEFDAPKARGLSFILVPIDQDGVQVRPIRSMTGDSEFCEVFFDGARASIDHTVGERGAGAKVALTLLGYERSTAAAAKYVGYRIEFDRLLQLIIERNLVDDSGVRQRLAWCYSKIEIMYELGRAALEAIASGQRPGPESSILKLYESEYHQRVTELAIDVLGAEGVSRAGEPGIGGMNADPLGSPNTPLAWQNQFMMARAKTIYGGSAQIQRNTIGERLLGLPAEPRQQDRT